MVLQQAVLHVDYVLHPFLRIDDDSLGISLMEHRFYIRIRAVCLTRGRRPASAS